MVDYEKLYYKMYIATTRALDILKVAQLECEDMYLEMSENKTNEDKVLYFSDYENFEPAEIVKEEDDDFLILFWKMIVKCLTLKVMNKSKKYCDISHSIFCNVNFVLKYSLYLTRIFTVLVKCYNSNSFACSW